MGAYSLLESLNGGNKGHLAEWLSAKKSSPRIAWYPSAGRDFRDVLYLHPKCKKVHRGKGPEPSAPDFFIHTDYCAFDSSDILDRRILFEDRRTLIEVEHREDLPCLGLTVHRDLVVGASGEANNRVVFMMLRVRSDTLGLFRRPLIYAFVENAAFCSRYLVGLKAGIGHIVQVRYGHNLGGSQTSPGWIRHQLGVLSTKVLVTDPEIHADNTNETVFGHFPNLRNPDMQAAAWRSIRRLPLNAWDGYGRVEWFALTGTAKRN